MDDKEILICSTCGIRIRKRNFVSHKHKGYEWIKINDKKINIYKLKEVK